MSTRLPNESGDILDARPLKGVLGLPNSGIGRVALPNTEGAGVPAMRTCGIFFEGVSGMYVLEKRAAGGTSILRLRLEMSPVDMNAWGSGLAIL